MQPTVAPRLTRLVMAVLVIHAVGGCEPEPALPCCWESVSIGDIVSCGIRVGGELDCWGAELPDELQSDPADYEDHPGLQEDGTVVYEGLLDAPAGEFDWVSSRTGSCAVTTAGHLVCWSTALRDGFIPEDWRDQPWLPALAPASGWAGVDLSWASGCVSGRDGVADCFYEGLDEVSTPIESDIGHAFGLLEPAGPFSELRSELGMACGLSNAGLWQCWGNPHNGGTLPIPSAQDLPSADWDKYRSNSETWAWVHDTSARDVELGDHVVSSANGVLPLCLLDESGAPHCPVGPGPSTETSSFRPDHLVVKTTEATRHADSYVDVALGNSHACFLHESGEIDCIGEDGFGQLGAPEGEHTAVFAGGDVSCAITVDGELRCWGDGAHGQLRIPE
jgi:hypothetical protein